MNKRNTLFMTLMPSEVALEAILHPAFPQEPNVPNAFPRASVLCDASDPS